MSTTPTARDRPLRADARRNREKILQAAREVVAEEGAAAQIDDVARKAGVGVGTVYRHFPTKDALIGELIAQCAEENAELARAQADVSDPWDAFAGLLVASCEMMAADAARRRVWTHATDEAFAHAQDAKLRMHDATEPLLARAHEAGVLRKDFRMEDLPGVMAAVSGAIECCATGTGPTDWHRVLDIVLAGLKTG